MEQGEAGMPFRPGEGGCRHLPQATLTSLLVLGEPQRTRLRPVSSVAKHWNLDQLNTTACSVGDVIIDHYRDGYPEEYAFYTNNTEVIEDNR